MSDLEFAIVVTSYTGLLACGLSFIVYGVLDTFFPLPGSRRRRW